MLISTHVLSGALLGRALRRPLPALLLGIGSHLALDRLPHFGQAGGWPPGRLDERMFRVAVVDGLVGLGLIGVVLAVTAPRHRRAVLAGVVGACLPDLDKPGRELAGRSPWPARFDRLHACLQVDVESPDLLGQDVAVAAVGSAATLGLLAADARRARPAAHPTG